MSNGSGSPLWLTKEQVVVRNHVNVIGSGPETLMFAHGFGCDQRMWEPLVSGLKERYTLVLFDYVGSGRSELSAFSPERYSTLEGYARDIIEICQALDLRNVHLVGHSVSASIGLFALAAEPERFSSHILICPSPGFLNDPPDYMGGFEQADLDELLELMDKNFIGWANYFAPLVLGETNPEPLIGELAGSFCSTDPLVAKVFARATFLADCRHMLAGVTHPALILQSADDALAGQHIGQYMRDRMPGSQLRVLDTQGHCIHLTHPERVRQEILGFLEP